jgi:anti-anti-sigma factor
MSATAEVDRMTAEHPHRPHCAPLGAPDQLFRDGTDTTAADDSGTIVLVVSRRTEAGHADDPTAVPLTVVAVDGELDCDTIHVLGNELARALDDGGPVCCDLARVTFFGAAAANLVLQAHERAVTAGQRFLLRDATPMTRRVLNAVDPDRILAWS